MLIAGGAIEKTDKGYFVEGYNLEEIAREHGTPLTAWSEPRIRELNRRQIKAITYAPTLHLYANKACNLLAIQGIQLQEGFGVQVGSVGEAELAFAAQRAVFGKEIPGLIRANSKNENEEYLIYCSNKGIKIYFDSLDGMLRYAWLLENGKINRALIQGIGINPGDGDGHDPNHTTTGGPTREHRIYYTELDEAIRISRDRSIPLDAAMIHIGSNFNEYGKFFEMVNFFLNDIIPPIEKQGFQINEIDVGGGLGRIYDLNEPEPNPTEWGTELSELMNNHAARVKRKPRLVAENSRYHVVDGVLLAEVVSVKKPVYKNEELQCPPKVIININGVTQLTRVAMYDDTWHPIINVSNPNGKLVDVRVYGDACEGDVMGIKPLAEPKVGDIIAITHSGAYCRGSMDGTYNAKLPGKALLLNPESVDVISELPEYSYLWQTHRVPDRLRK